MNKFQPAPGRLAVREVSKLIGHTDSVNCASFSDDNRMLASGGQDRTVRVWDVRSGQQLFCLAHEETVWSVLIHPNNALVISGDWNGVVHVWSAISGELRAKYRPHKNHVGCISILPGGRYVLTGGASGDSILWDLANGRELVRVEHRAYGRLVKASLSGSHHAMCVLEDSGRVDDPEHDDFYPYEFYRAEVIDLASGKILGHWRDIRQSIKQREHWLPNPWAFRGTSDMDPEQIELSVVDVSPGGAFAALGYRANSVYVWDFKRKMIVRRFSEETDDYISDLRFLRGNRHLMITTWNMTTGRGKTSVWDIRSETRLYGGSMVFRPIAASTSGRHFVDSGPNFGLSVCQLLTSAPRDD